MATFIRFGKVPKNGKSINFLKLSFDQQEDFNDLCVNGEIDRAYEELPTDCFEAGVSCFFADSKKLPKLENLKQISSLTSRIGEDIYLVDGDVVGFGQDGEPLVNVSKFEKIEIKKDILINLALDFLKKNYKNCEIDKDGDINNLTIHKFVQSYEINNKTGDIKQYYCFPSKNCTHYEDRTIITFAGMTFSEPVPGFNDKLGM